MLPISFESGRLFWVSISNLSRAGKKNTMALHSVSEFLCIILNLRLPKLYPLAFKVLIPYRLYTPYSPLAHHLFILPPCCHCTPRVSFPVVHATASKHYMAGCEARACSIEWADIEAEMTSTLIYWVVFKHLDRLACTPDLGYAFVQEMTKT